MILIVCVDDAMGMAFNGRRQSQDRVLRTRMLERARGRPLWMSPYSARQFGRDLPDGLRPDEDFLLHAGAGELCFVETVSPAAYLERIEGLVLYRWGRRYPSDLALTLPMKEFHLQTTTGFTGSSHPWITEEVYVR